MEDANFYNKHKWGQKKEKERQDNFYDQNLEQRFSCNVHIMGGDPMIFF